MATNRIQFKRTSVTGRTPNTTNLANSQYIASGELAINLTDSKLYTSNGSVLIDLTGSVNTTKFITMSQPGYVSSPYTGISRFYPPNSISIYNISSSVSNTVSGTNLTYKLFKNGSDTGETYTISVGQNISTPVSANISLTTSDYLTVNLVTGTAYDLRVFLKYS